MKMKQKSQNKAMIAMSAVILLLVALSITLTFAYFTAQDKTTNGQGITFDTLTLKVTEADWTMAESESETLTTVVPGCKINMAGKVELTGAPAYLKVDFTVNGTAAQGKTLDDVATGAIITALGDVLKAQTVGNWVQVVDDNAWYCIASNEEGVVIDFTKGSVIIPLATTGNEWQGATIEISYTVSAIQSAHVELTGTDTEKATTLQGLFNGLNISTGLAK